MAAYWGSSPLMVTNTTKPARMKNAIVDDCGKIYIPIFASAAVPVFGYFTPTRYATTATMTMTSHLLPMTLKSFLARVLGRRRHFERSV